jgi:hypothetical protein
MAIPPILAVVVTRAPGWVLQVRTLIGNGEAEEAVELCHQVTEVLIEELLTSPVAYSDYVCGWELQRKYAVSEVALDLDLAAPAKVLCPSCLVLFFFLHSSSFLRKRAYALQQIRTLLHLTELRHS